MTQDNGASRRLEVALRGEREVVMTRSFEAPRELVWEACTRPEHLRRWWGVWGGAEMAVCEMDFREGGSYRYVLREPEGEEFAFWGEFRQVVAPERTLQTLESSCAPGHVSVEAMTLHESGGVTTMTIVCLLASPEDRDAMLATDMEAGAGASYDQLEELLHEMQAAVA